jgi:hypothetical protein
MIWPRAWFRSRPLRMLWKVEKDGCISYLVGTAHFFPYSFARPLTRLFEQVETVIFEGPLDPESMEKIAQHGRSGDGSLALVEQLDPAAVREINRILRQRLGDQDETDLYLFLQPSAPGYFELYTQNMRPWMALFSVWSTYLDWKYSLDLEAYQVARRMGVETCFLETLEEQLAVLDGIPLERILGHLNDVKNWKIYKDHYVRLFLEGNLDGLVSTTDRFPTRGPVIVSQRDRLMFERMKGFFEPGRAAALVGFPHIPGLRQLFLDQGYQVSQESR